MRLAAGAVLVVLLVIAAHRPTLEVGLLGHDSYPILATSVLEAGGSPWRILDTRLVVGDGQLDFYRPLLNLSAALEYSRFGLEPRGYQAVSLAMFAACAVALFAFVGRLTGRSLAAGVAAGAFALHPATLEVLPVMSRRPESLCCLFTLLALHASISPAALRLHRPPILPGVLALLALGAKETALLLPVLGFALVAFVSERPGLRERIAHGALAAVPLAAAVGLATGARLAVLGGLGGHGKAGFASLVEADDLLLWVALPAEAMQRSPLAPWLLLAAALALVATAALGLRAPRRQDPDLRRSLRAGAFASVWLVLMLALHAFTGRIQPWYALFPAAGWCMGLGIGIDGLAARALRPGAAALRGSAAAAALLLAILLGWTLRSSPLSSGYETWQAASRFQEGYLEAVGGAVEGATPGSVVAVDRLPTRFATPSGPRSAAMLHYYSLRAWLDLRYPDRKTMLAVTPYPEAFVPVPRRIVLALPGHHAVGPASPALTQSEPDL